MNPITRYHHNSKAQQPNYHILHNPTQLEQLMLKSHIRLGLKTNTSTEDISQSRTLFSKCVDDRCSWWSQWSLQHVTENAQDTVEVLVILGGSTIGVDLPGDTSHHLG